MKNPLTTGLVVIAVLGVIAIAYFLTRDANDPRAPRTAGMSGDGSANPSPLGGSVHDPQPEAEALRTADADPPVPSIERSDVTLSDPGLDACLAILEELENPDSPQSVLHRKRGPTEFNKLIGEMATSDLSDEQRRDLYRTDETWRTRVGEAHVQAQRTVMSMAIEAIADNRYTQFRPGDADPALDPAAQSMARMAKLREILDRYDGPEGDRSYMSCGGSEYGTSRVIEFYRSQHPQYFEAFERIHRLEELRAAELEDRLRSMGRLRATDLDSEREQRR